MFARIVLILFVGAFVLEAWLFLVVGQQIGLLLTLVWILGSFVAGVVLMRLEGLRMLFGIHVKLQRGVLPTREVLNGLAVVLGGVLLVLPGYFTDVLGLGLILPPSRSLMVYWLVRSLDNRFQQGRSAGGDPGGDSPRRSSAEGSSLPPSEEVIEIPIRASRDT